jgi:hypothetical protein
MRVVLLLLITFLICNIFSVTSTDVTKLSTHQSVELLKVIDQLETCKTNGNCLEFYNKYNEITGLNYDSSNVTSVKNSVYKTIEQNTTGKSWFSKMTGLITFKNIVLVLLVLASLGLVYALADTLRIFSLGLFFSEPLVYLYGYILSLGGLSLRFDAVTDTWLENIFVFYHHTPLFFAIGFAVVNFMFLAWLCGQNRRRQESDVVMLAMILNLIVFTTSAIYHSNEIIGICAVMVVFYIFGFHFGAFGGGYYAGVDSKYLLERLIVVSFMLNIIYNIYGESTWLSVFGTGIVFWATFVGCVSTLILCNGDYYYGYSTRSIIGFLVKVLFAIVVYLGLIFVGNLLGIQSYRNIGGTFMAFTVMDLQRYLLVTKYNCQSNLLIMSIIVANLYTLVKLLTWYPEYFLLV